MAHPSADPGWNAAAGDNYTSTCEKWLLTTVWLMNSVIRLYTD